MSEWFVEGVDRQTQILAKQAAKRAGLSVGQWLEKHIRLQTGLLLDKHKIEEQAVGKVKNETTRFLNQKSPDYFHNKIFLYPRVIWANIANKTSLAILSVAILMLIGGGYFVWKNHKDNFNETVAFRKANQHILSNMPLNSLKKLASDGDGYAQLELGKRFLKGNGINVDAARARSLFISSADNGVADAMFQLAYLYEQGLGVPADQEQSTNWYKRAVEAGSAKAAIKINNKTKDSTKLEQNRSQNTIINNQMTSSKKNPTLTTDQITELQTLLTKLDLFSSKITGILDRETVTALKLYQNFAGLPTDGRPTPSLLLDLRQVVAAMSEQSSVE